MTLAKFNPRRLVIYSRDEMKQWEMARHFADDKRVRFFIGDVRDARPADAGARRHRLCGPRRRAQDRADRGIQSVRMRQDQHHRRDEPDRRLHRSTASNGWSRCRPTRRAAPVNLYGATKLVSDKLFVAGNAYAGGHDTRFAVVRYGNVMGSRGSVIPFFMSLAGQGPLPITDPRHDALHGHAGAGRRTRVARHRRHGRRRDLCAQDRRR